MTNDLSPQHLAKVSLKMELIMTVVRMKIPNDKNLSRLFGSREGKLLTSSSHAWFEITETNIVTNKWIKYSYQIDSCC